MTTAVPVYTNDGADSSSYPPAQATPTPATTATSSPTPVAAPAATPPVLPAATQRVSSLLNAVATDIPTLVVPLSPVPSQTLAVTLGNQVCVINLYTRSTGLYLDLYVADVAICRGVICLDRNIIVRAAYLGFHGELTFIDSQGVSDPTYDGLGSRYNLIWLDC